MMEMFGFRSHLRLGERKATIRSVIYHFGLKRRAICHLLFAIGRKGSMI
jgi:hypothetical protein